MADMDSTPPPSSKGTFDSRNGGVSLKWIERELSRLDAGKVDKAHYKPALESLKDKHSNVVRDVENLRQKLSELKRELSGDITGVQDIATDAQTRAAQHVCTQHERFETVEKTVNFWGTWFLRGLVGMILLLITAGGGWVYSHVRLEETAKQSSKAVAELKSEVDKVHDIQQQQRATLIRIENAEKPMDTEEVEAALRDVLQEVLEKKKSKR
jgi:hypothetical protein